MKNGLQTRVDSVIDDAISKKRIVGTVILISLDGTIVYQRPAGFADREEGRAMVENHVFRLASFTKPLVSAGQVVLWKKPFSKTSRAPRGLFPSRG